MARLVVLSAFLYSCASKHDPKNKMPEFSIRLSDSTTILNTANIPKGKPIVFIHFEADCKDCQETVDSLLQRMTKVKDVRFYFLSIEKFSQVTLFRDYYKLYNYPNITIGQDYTRFLPRYFESYATPAIALFGPDKILRETFQGKPNVDFLIDRILIIKSEK